MKKVILVSFMVIALTTGYGYAQMGGSMMGGHGHRGQEKGGMMSDQKSQTGSVMHTHKMPEGMTQTTLKMGNMMHKMSDMMGKDMGPENATKMSAIMKDMSRDMMDMSNMMKSGKISHEDMNKLQQRMMETEKRLNMMMR